MTTLRQIETLQAQAAAARDRAAEAYAESYDADAEIARLRGETLEAEFCTALARCYRERTDEATAAKDRAYYRLQASRCMGGRFDGIPPAQMALVTAAVEELRAEGYAPPPSIYGEAIHG
jgi:hypothetical protein